MAVGRSLLPMFREEESQAHRGCATCPNQCRPACPVAEVEQRQTFSPHRLMGQASLLVRERVLAPSVGAAPWACTGCGRCTEACPHGIDVPTWLLLARNRVFAAGQAPSAVPRLTAAFGVAGTPQGVDHGPSLRAATGMRPARSRPHVYVPGCELLARTPEQVQRFLALSERLGLGLGLTDASASCCGAPLAWAGELEAFRAHARRFAHALEGASTVVVHDTSCARTLLELYPRFGVEVAPRVLTVARRLAEAAFVEPDREAAFLRCCSSDLDEAPAGFGTPLRTVGCCGAAGLLPETHPETAAALAAELGSGYRERARRGEAEHLVVESPRCELHLARHLPDLPVIGLVEHLASTSS